MFNFALYKRSIRGNLKILELFAVVLTMYVSIIIAMYDPKMMGLLDEYVNAMPEIMAAVGMTAGATSLIGFMISYLYGFIVLVFPMVFSILCANKLIAGHVDKGSMTYLLAAPVKRRSVAFTQLCVILSGILALVLYITAIELTVSAVYFPGELDIPKLLLVNAGLLCLHLFIGGICFLCSCIFSDSKYSIGLGGGIPALMYIIQMMSNVNKDLNSIKYATFFTLFDPTGIMNGEQPAILCAVLLLAGAVLLYIAAITIFTKKDLHI